MKKYIVVSVPHNGTRMLKSILNCRGYHPFMPNLDDLVKGKQIVTPLRHPREVVRSHQRRRGTGHQVRWSNILKSWELIQELWYRYPIHFVCMDLPIRDLQLAQIGYESDWKVLAGHLPDSEAAEGPFEDVDIDWVYQLPYIKRFYEQYPQD